MSNPLCKQSTAVLNAAHLDQHVCPRQDEKGSQRQLLYIYKNPHGAVLVRLLKASRLNRHLSVMETREFAVLKFAMLLLEIKHVLKLHFSDWQPSVSKSAKCCRSSQRPIHLQQHLKRTNHKATNGTNGTNSQRIRAGLRIQILQLLARATKGQSGLCM